MREINVSNYFDIIINIFYYWIIMLITNWDIK